MKKIGLTIVWILGMAGLAGAQVPYENLIYFSWDYNIPLSNRNFIDNGSGKGLQIGYRKMINEKFYMGFDFNSASFSDYSPRQTYYYESGAYTTDFFKYVNSFGLTVSGDYFFRPDKRLVPFAGMGIGASANTFKEFYNIYQVNETKWGLLLRPEAGALMKMGKEHHFAFCAAVHFDYSTSSSVDFGYNNFSSVGLRLGIIIAIVN